MTVQLNREAPASTCVSILCPPAVYCTFRLRTNLVIGAIMEGAGALRMQKEGTVQDERSVVLSLFGYPVAYSE